jgi:phospholipid/cholesterol/gamma-HCH transport system substrate-binding protein
MTVLFETGKSGELPGRARRRPMSPRRRRQALGAVGLLVIAAIIAGAILAYEQVFTPGVPATVLSPRAGLLMENGADVTLDGITVGRVTSITPVGDTGARLGISIFPSQVAYIPANVQAQIDAPSVFGPKFLNLVPPRQPDAARMRADEVIEPAQVATEIDTVFSSLVSVLNSVHPAQVSATLGALSTALNGRGARLGDFIGQLNSYLRDFNPSLPALGNDLSLAPTVASTYSAAAPDLIKTFDNLRVTSGTLVDQQAQFDAFLVNMTGFAGNAQSFLASNENGITRTLATLLPTDDLLAGYSPEIPCLAASANQINTISVTNDLILNTSVVPGANPYSNPGNLPVVGASSPASCYGGPLTRAETENWPHVNFNDGTQNYFSKNEAVVPGSGVSLAQTLFGPAASRATSAASSATAKKGH